MNRNSKGKLIIVSAPSGAGKTTLVKHLLNSSLNLGFSVSATSRPKRTGETDGKDYFFLTTEDFREKIKNGDLLEWEEVYEGSYYGTLKTEVEKLLFAGKNVIFDVDVVGGLNIKKIYGKRALSVFISPPSIEVLELRLTNRGTDSAATIAHRMEKARWELDFAPQFDLILINDNLEAAKQLLLDKVKEFTAC
ncbi:MAG: guanylate [Bacteroidetes bacterium]|nr:MAG: guanylate [Bacteroidota bacterium]